jgi:hypothetical protein
MGWWFGRKSAPADARPFVPAWLQNDAAEEGFARSAHRLARRRRLTAGSHLRSSRILNSLNTETEFHS